MTSYRYLGLLIFFNISTTQADGERGNKKHSSAGPQGHRVSERWLKMLHAPQAERWREVHQTTPECEITQTTEAHCVFDLLLILSDGSTVPRLKERGLCWVRVILNSSSACRCQRQRCHSASSTVSTVKWSEVKVAQSCLTLWTRQSMKFSRPEDCSG